MPFTIAITVTDRTVTLGVGSSTLTQYKLYLQTGEIREQYSNVFTNLPDGDHAVQGTQTLANGTTETDYQEFNITGTAVYVPTTFSLVTKPGYLQAVYNPMLVQLQKSDYKIGDLFFVEVWTLPGRRVLLNAPKAYATLHRTLIVNGDATGKATIDISDSLSSLFQEQNQYVPNTVLAHQKDESAYVPYYFLAGTLKYDEQNRPVKTYLFNSTVAYALRAALKLNQTDWMIDYVYQFDGEPVRPLTSIPDNARRKPSEPTLLSYFIALENEGPTFINRAFVMADLTFLDGTSQSGFFVNEFDLDAKGGGLYLVDAKPQRLVTHPRYAELVSYTVYLDYFDDTLTTTMTSGRTFTVGEDVQLPVEVTFMNRLGGWDTLSFRRDRNTDIKTKSSVFTTGYGARTFQVDSTTSTTYNSGWLTQVEYTWLKDLMLSPAVYIDGEYVRTQDTTYKFDSSLGLFSMEITVSPDAEENSIRL
ncbi:hypothetical protein [Hymenobacter siberiensis]|uniref:hypothetical protein n=1 Tax=Hymenobacter siberiensis TaxID=2848396 RepID=UPI001C1E7338|nr:hypothetical protein [Hymenobacter siberiensis]